MLYKLAHVAHGVNTRIFFFFKLCVDVLLKKLNKSENVKMRESFTAVFSDMVQQWDLALVN